MLWQDQNQPILKFLFLLLKRLQLSYHDGESITSIFIIKSRSWNMLHEQQKITCAPFMSQYYIIIIDISEKFMSAKIHDFHISVKIVDKGPSVIR